MRKFKFGKLVRDNIVKGIIAVGNVPNHRKLNEDEYVQELKNKLLEETKELPTAQNTEVIGELADIQEIIDNLLIALNTSKEELKTAQEKKNNKNGSFKNRDYIEYVEAQDDSTWIEYYTQNPEKYPEIRD